MSVCVDVCVCHRIYVCIRVASVCVCMWMCVCLSCASLGNTAL